MSSETVTFKLVVVKDQKETGDIRRVTLQKPVSYKTFVSAAQDLLHADELKFRYLDDDGDRILLSSQYELDTAIGVCGPKNVIRIFVEILKERVQEQPAAEIPHVVNAIKVEEPKAEEKKTEINVEEAPKVEEKKEIKMEAPKADEKKKDEEVKGEEPKAEEPKAEEPKAEEKKPDPEHADPFADVFAAFHQIPGVKLSDDGKGTRVVDVDFSKLFSPESCAAVSEAFSSAIKKMAEAAEATKANAAANMKVDENAGVYSHVLHSLPDSVVHHRVQCDGCGKSPICGMRYKCAMCDDYDLCQDCIRRAGELHDPSHLFCPITRPFPMGGFPRFGPRVFPRPHPCPFPHPRPHFHPQPVPERHPEPEKQPEPEKPKEEPKKDELLDEKYASLHMTPAEMRSIHILMDMGFPNVEADLFCLRGQNGVINDVLIDTLVRNSA